MPQNTFHSANFVTRIVANAGLSILLILPVLAGCSRTAEPPAAVVTEADRASPVPVDVPDPPPATSGKAALQSVQRKIPVEDTLEPVPIDDASVPSNATGFSAQRAKK